MDRRMALKNLGLVGCASGVSALVSACGSDDGNTAAGSGTSSLPDVAANMAAMADYYKKTTSSYISTKQSSGAVYGTKVYANPVTVGEAVASGADTTQALSVIRGFYWDPSDTGHTPVVTTTSADGGSTLSISLAHGVTTVADKDGNHGITALDVWIAGGASPVKSHTFEAAASGSSTTPVVVSLTLTSTDVGDATHVYVISHCNNHGGRVVMAALS